MLLLSYKYKYSEVFYMSFKNKKEIFSIRKFKVGVGSALIGISVLGVGGGVSIF